MEYRDLAERIVDEISYESFDTAADQVEYMLEDYFRFKEENKE
jgi:hypothetical protein